MNRREFLSGFLGTTSVVALLPFVSGYFVKAANGAGLQAGEWHHVVYATDGLFKPKIYINGALWRKGEPLPDSDVRDDPWPVVHDVVRRVDPAFDGSNDYLANVEISVGAGGRIECCSTWFKRS